MYFFKNTDGYEQIRDKYNVSNLVAKVIVSKELDNQQIDALFDDFKSYDSFAFDDMEKARERIFRAIDNKEKIVIYGDYDADGMLAVSVLVKTFELLGVNVGFYIPNRLVDGYGITKEMIERFHQKEYSLIITVDNGINANEELVYAKECGIDVIITDHHELVGEMPCYYALLHPQYSNYPNKELSGAMVAYKLATVLLGRDDDYLLTLASFSLLTDVMLINDENRYYLRKAKKIIEDNNYIMISKLFTGKSFNFDKIRFEIGPKINAVGRLPDISDPHNIVHYFCNNDFDRNNYIKHLNEVNNLRKKYVNGILSGNANIKILENVVYLIHDDIHEGVAGILAANMVRKYRKTAFVLTYNENTDLYKGSGRTDSEVNLANEIEKIDYLCTKFGGHEMAVGLSITKDAIDTFFNELDKLLSIASEKKEEVIEVTKDDLTVEQIDGLEIIEPFGKGFESPVFIMRNVVIDNIIVFGKMHLRLLINSDGNVFEALYFNKSFLAKQFYVSQKIDIVFTCSIGNNTPKLFVENILVSNLSVVI